MQGVKQSHSFKFSLLLAITIVLSYSSNAQHGYYGSFVPPADRSPHHLILTINPQDGAYLKKDYGVQDLLTQVHGEKVLGFPFLIYEWSNGSLTTSDGRVYQYPLRYNVWEQLVSFVNGSDTLDVTDEINEFTLKAVVTDTVVLMHFINAAQYQKEKKAFYYQLILDSKDGQLLKSYQKNIASLTEGLLESKGTKYFELRSSYYYYNKKFKKIYKIDPDGTNLEDILNADSQTFQSITTGFNFKDDEDLIRFFKKYFNLN